MVEGRNFVSNKIGSSKRGLSGCMSVKVSGGSDVDRRGEIGIGGVDTTADAQ